MNDDTRSKAIEALVSRRAPSPMRPDPSTQPVVADTTEEEK